MESHLDRATANLIEVPTEEELAGSWVARDIGRRGSLGASGSYVGAQEVSQLCFESRRGTFAPHPFSVMSPSCVVIRQSQQSIYEVRLGLTLPLTRAPAPRAWP